MQKRCHQNGGSTTLHSKAKGGKKIGLDFKTLFLGFSNFSKVFKRLCVLEHSREKSLLDLDLDGVSFPISLLKRVKLIFISLLPSRASNIHSRRTLKFFGRCEVNFRQTTLVQCHKVSLRSHFLSSSILVFWFVNSATSASFHTCHHQVNPIFLFFWKCSLYIRYSYVIIFRASTSGIVISSSYLIFVPIGTPPYFWSPKVRQRKSV